MLRPIRPDDDAALAAIARASLAELGVDDDRADLERLSAAHAGPGAGFLVLEEDGQVVGGGGYGPWDGAPPGTCELRRMYLAPEQRGRGRGRALLEALLAAARADGYTVCALHTHSRMAAARRLYAAAGFVPPKAPLPSPGCGCDLQLTRDLR